MAFDPGTRLRVAFAGTPDFAVPSLVSLLQHPACSVVACYTQPDRPAGRGRRAQASPVKIAAADAGVAVRQPVNFTSPDTIRTLADDRIDLLVVAAYGLLLPRAVLDSVETAVNVHASLLPRWRGAAPIQRAIMAGDMETGISMMRVIEALDAGPVYLQRRVPITPEDTGGSLHDKLALLGGQCLGVFVDRAIAGTLEAVAQDDTLATYAKKITAADRILDFSLGVGELARRVRALNPAPVATVALARTTLKVWAATALPGAGRAAPGTIVAAHDEGVDVAAADGILRLTQLQPEGKKPMAARDFVNGFRHLLDAN